MKKLNIFHPKKRPNSQELPTAPTDTLGRIVNAKEEAQRSWEQEQVEFANRRREHEIKMIEMEQTEVKRREVEVRKLGDDLIEIRRKNKVIQDKVAEQIQILRQKLEEYKLDHKAQEESLEDEIVTKEDVIANVKESLEIRMKAVELEIQDCSDSKLSEEESQRATMYPTIPSDQVRKGSSSIWNPKNASSLQKSPILSPHSLDSSRSDTPRTDSSEGDTTSM